MSSPTSKDYLAIANKYIDDVLKGVIPAKKEVRLACNRQKKDLVLLEREKEFLHRQLQVWIRSLITVTELDLQKVDVPAVADV